MTTRTAFVIGATGLIGGAVAGRLAHNGWSVSGLARARTSADRLDRAGIEPVIGDLQDGISVVLDRADSSESVVVAAQLDGPTERELIAALIPRLRDKSLIFISGSGVMLERSAGEWSDSSYAEDEDFPVEPLALDRRAAELAVRAGVESGVRSIVIRAGMVWGPGGHGILPMVYQSVAKVGAAAYVGAGRNVYAEVHIEDLAALVEIVLDRGVAGALYHAVGGETPTRWIAEAVARDLEVPTRSLTDAEAQGVWGEFGAVIMGASSRIRAPRSRDELGWTATHRDLLSQVGDRSLRAEAGR